PILHLNGYKIAGPTVLARIRNSELDSYLRGCGYTPYFVEGDDPAEMHELFSSTLESVIEEIQSFQRSARSQGFQGGPRWPMIVLRTPKGWTGPKTVDGKPVEGTWRSHQVPLSDPRRNPQHLTHLEQWLRSYRPEQLFDSSGRPDFADLHPRGTRRMSANPHANG